MHYEQLCVETGRSTVLAKLEAASREFTGGGLILFLCRGEEVLELQPGGRKATLPDFCQVYRTTAEGRRRCLTCRSLMAFGACYRGLIDYTCHGQVSIIAGSTAIELEDGSRPVVASCSFASEDQDDGWLQTRGHASGLGIDLRDLRRAYYNLPTLTEDRRRLARGLVEITASLIGEMISRHDHGLSGALPPGSEKDHTTAEPDLEHVIESNLFVSHCDCDDQVKNPGGPHLIQLVIDMVDRNPAVRYSVTSIARAARMSPNHFSTVFRRHAGRTFSDFLTEKRITLARNLLRDFTLNINQVAVRTGFSDAGYFIRRFKQKTGKTPMEWRNTL